jgi:hypothetical protein
VCRYEDFKKLCTGPVTHSNGDKLTLLEGLKHSFHDKPSSSRGDCDEWHQNDKMHRDSGPALVYDRLDLLRAVWYKAGYEARAIGPSDIRISSDHIWIYYLKDSCGMSNLYGPASLEFSHRNLETFSYLIGGLGFSAEEFEAEKLKKGWTAEGAAAEKAVFDIDAFVAKAKLCPSDVSYVNYFKEDFQKWAAHA